MNAILEQFREENPRNFMTARWNAYVALTAKHGIAAVTRHRERIGDVLTRAINEKEGR